MYQIQNLLVIVPFGLSTLLLPRENTKKRKTLSQLGGFDVKN